MAELDLSELSGKRILITGATGLIGKAVIKRLLSWNQITNKPIKILALIRNKDKADKIFGSYKKDMLEFIISDVTNIKIADRGIDYIIHGANETSSKAFVAKPVETILTGLKGTKRILDLARINPVKGFIYLSSMEVYGSPSNDEKITEDYVTNLDTMKVRSCYPESKRMCENLCVSYASEYGVPARVIRLTQTFGPGVQYDDCRVFAEFARCVIEKKDIFLNTKGDTKRSYLYTEDAVDAILMVLLYGKNGEAYNAANEQTYCSIYDMACMVAEKCAEGKIEVVLNVSNDIQKLGYAPTLMMNLDTFKLRTLGWSATVDLEQMFKNMINSMHN